jgi:hypothetical protein
VKIELGETAVRIELSPFEKIASLHGDVELPYRAIESAEVDPDPLRRMGWGRFSAVGVRVPGVRFLCTTGWGRELWSIRRGRPALRLHVRQGRLREVTVDAADAAALARQIAERAAQPG